MGNDEKRIPVPSASLPSGPEKVDGHGKHLSRNDEFSPEALTPIQPPPESQPLARRRFLGLVGASAALAATLACKSPDEESIVPYTKKPADVIPGVANYYASTYQEGLVPYGVLVKTREGRPIHIDGNDEHPLFRGKTSLRAQAEVIGLYDPDRLRQPAIDSRPADWREAEGHIVPALKRAAADKKAVLLLTPAVISPTRKEAIAELKKVLPTLRHVAWEPALPLTARAAAKALFGEALAPRYGFEKADVIAAFEADFLGGMEEAVTAIGGYAQRRRPRKADDPVSRLYAIEGAMSLTGSKADDRIPLRPSAAAPLAFAVARALHERHAVALPDGLSADVLSPFSLSTLAAAHDLDPRVLTAMVDDLANAGTASLVIAGPSLPPEAHVACALINVMLGAEGNTVDTSFAPDAVSLASPADIAALTDDLASGDFAAAVFWEVNPAYAHPDAERFLEAVQKVPLRVRLGLMQDETAEACQVVLPVNHWMEAWGDYEAGTDLLSLQQPLIRPLYDTKQAEEVILGWAGALGAPVKADYHAYLMDCWRNEVYPAAQALASFEDFWFAALHDGVLRRDVKARPPRTLRPDGVASAAQKAAGKPGGGMDLVLAPDLRLWDGRYGNIGWLQELPAPLTKLTWGNAVALSPPDAKKAGLHDGDVLLVGVGGREVELPALIQPGQAPGVLLVALGHGRTAGSVATGVGANAFGLVAVDGGTPFLRQGAGVTRTGRSEPLIRTQGQFSLEGRDEYIAHLWTLDEYKARAAHPGKKPDLATLYPKLEFPVHKWGMAIDMSACVGCAGCEIACQSENNVPVVGPDRVAKGRIMHWIRIDTYYKGDPANPTAVHQPMLCQQCNDAPCENVCPVAATTHSPEGLNEMIYNRCVGTRYCSNNCPYKVRRFNFFDYTSFIKDPLDLAFNPEVTVRPRGVMEKCTFCIQRIQNGEQVAQDEGHPVRDGEIRPACAVACPAEAIVFGDLKDENSRVSQLSRSDRGYKVLDELGVRPSITYLAELRNPTKDREEKNA